MIQRKSAHSDCQELYIDLLDFQKNISNGIVKYT